MEQHHPVHVGGVRSTVKLHSEHAALRGHRIVLPSHRTTRASRARRPRMGRQDHQAQQNTSQRNEELPVVRSRTRPAAGRMTSSSDDRLENTINKMRRRANFDRPHPSIPPTLSQTRHTVVFRLILELRYPKITIFNQFLASRIQSHKAATRVSVLGVNALANCTSVIAAVRTPFSSPARMIQRRSARPATQIHQAGNPWRAIGESISLASLMTRNDSKSGCLYPYSGDYSFPLLWALSGSHLHPSTHADAARPCQPAAFCLSESGVRTPCWPCHKNGRDRSPVLSAPPSVQGNTLGP